MPKNTHTTNGGFHIDIIVITLFDINLYNLKKQIFLKKALHYHDINVFFLIWVKMAVV